MESPALSALGSQKRAARCSGAMGWLSAMLLVLPLFFSGGFWGCANPVAPSGGPRDTLPPRLDTTLSTPNFQTHFQKQRIELQFDEWVQLKDVFQQVVVSPPLEYPPKIYIRKKAVRFEFDEREELRPDATYVINFGEAIRDLTENNPAELVFVFSTGAYIDSLQVEGHVVDAFSGEPVPEVLFLLYENPADSVIFTERPFYFGRTDEQGFFRIANVKSGRFKGLALDDENLNYLYDGEGEAIGFLDSLLVVSDSVQPRVLVRLFREEPPLFLRSREVPQPGLVRLVFNRPPFDARLEVPDSLQPVFSEAEKDTLRLWHAGLPRAPWNLLLLRDTLRDTILLEPPASIEYPPLRLTPPKTRPREVLPGRALALKLARPLARVDTAAIRLLEDSLRIPVPVQARVDSLHPRTLLLDFPRKAGASYELRLLPGALTDWWGQSNADTLHHAFKALAREDLASLTLQIEGLDSALHYVVRLLKEKETEPLREFRVARRSTWQRTFDLLHPGNYRVEIIEDRNADGRWTTGNYRLHRQPERRFLQTLEPLRANWEVNVTLIPDFSVKLPAKQTF